MTKPLANVLKYFLQMWCYMRTKTNNRILMSTEIKGNIVNFEIFLKGGHKHTQLNSFNDPG